MPTPLIPMSTSSSAPLRREPGTALHRQLFMVLRDQIAQGVYPVGELIPPEDALCERFAVSRITVRRAVSDLEHLGLVEKRPGRGTFVRAAPRPMRPHPSFGLLESLDKQARETEVTVLGVETIPAPALVAQQLALEPGESAVHAVRLRSVRGTPVMFTDAWVPREVGGHVTPAELKKRALFEILLSEGVKFGRVIQEVSAVAADPVLAGLLNVEIGAPLVRLVRLLHDRRRRPVQYIVIHIAGDRSRILMDVPADAVNTTGAGQIAHDPAFL
ncbi:GntR family transcriptional regulator [Variovorax dokdonensis]|uniref:GntR family transcriptional regulator n=1 Tax=Variovorax dokdonensis TaxID=344883 RepID=A0ABT7NAP4_9BURK|nr:GntR family transcriptional regulator [Variovorax dokdonensis]MDM0045013.1 GntR family transcriptional regulator [Variovorax dokdonensis]